MDRPTDSILPWSADGFRRADSYSRAGKCFTAESVHFIEKFTENQAMQYFGPLKEIKIIFRMKRLTKYFGLLFLVLAIGCSKSEDAEVNNMVSSDPIAEIPTDPERVDYNLLSANNSGVTGTASFIPNSDGTTTVYIELFGDTDELHPVTINYGDVESGGTVAITLEVCECAISETLVTQLDNGTSITFVELMTFDGHISIYQSPTDASLIATANIGSNAF